ncbi:hypothetical protein PV327_001784 [Microctonus hyperodae]|uniref:Lipid droplet-associated hydrolase n=1 Tax=Microctonus hyperodae TaxID=165561 RepID=A0AA39KND9_MICHY|nr:hypothetical protein PV327_001784 [Microctonus hyperodae]
MQQSMLAINGVQTHVITEGRWVEEGLASDGHKDIVLVIPGNPGIPSYYEGFIKSLKSKLPTETPVWIMGHAGHVLPPKNLSIALPEGQFTGKYYNLAGQLEHKISFIKKYVPEDAKLHLVGHSIGCWLILQLLKDKQIADRVVKCYLLFPAIERMRETPSGKFLTNFVLRFAAVIVYLCWIFSLLPIIIQMILIRIIGGIFGVTNKSVKPTLQLLKAPVLKRVFDLAKDEMILVRELNYEIVSKYADKLWIYYGATDGWTPGIYYDELKAKYPNINAQICKRGFRHAFVLSNDDQVGKMVGDIINESIL